MQSETIHELDPFSRSLKNLENACRSSESARLFWPSFLECMVGVASARMGILAGSSKEEPTRWKKIAIWPTDGMAGEHAKSFIAQLETATGPCVEKGFFLSGLNGSASRGNRDFLLAVRLDTEQEQETFIAAFLLLSVSDLVAEEALRRLRLVAPAQIIYHWRRQAEQAQASISQFSAVLDLMIAVNAEKRFLAAALAFCNGIATRYDCDRVSLGWLERGYIRLRAISRTERFDRNMGAVKLLELAMEEAFDQDEELICPRPEGSALVTKDHEKFAREHTVNHLCSLPLRQDNKPIAVLTCERQKRAFTQTELQQFRLACDQAIHRLETLKRHDRWFGARLATVAREQLAKLVGPEHTWAKVLSVLGVVALVVLFLPIFNYRVEGNFILRSDDISYLTAPFDGYLSKVNVRPGDPVQANAVLLSLDTTDLELDEVSASAEFARYTREAEKARAESHSKESALAEMKISQALADQAKARLDLIRYRLTRASVKAPFDGVLVEGDLRQRIGAPLKQGDSLMRVARIDTLYVEADIEERDVQEILNKSSGEIAFVTQPKLKFPIKVTRIEPAAMPKEGKNVFVVRCVPEGKLEPWWRPGMSGVCKLNVEKRTLFWIISHRTVDFLRMLLWW